MKIFFLILSLLLVNFHAHCVFGEQRHIHVTAGVGSNQLPLYVGKDLGILRDMG